MKKLLIAVLAAAFVLGSFGIASAKDTGLWTKGMMNVTFQYLTNGDFGSMKQYAEDNDLRKNRFQARQRTRLVLEYVKDENLSATLQFEIDQNWGWGGYPEDGNVLRGSGGRVTSDGTNIMTRHAYIDWIVPDTELMVRMGVQPVALPWALPGGNSVLNADAAAVSLSYKFNDYVAANLFWSRLWDNDNWGTYWGEGTRGKWDAFGLIVPLTFDGIAVTPYAVYSRLGQNIAEGDGILIPYDGSNKNYNGWWLGLSGSLTMFDPFFVNLDVLYGSLSNGGRSTSNHGWFTGLQVGYKFDFVTPSLVAFYSSGNSKNRTDNSRIPVISGDNQWFGPTTFGTDGDFNLGASMAFTNGMNGLWGIGLKLADITFAQDLYHTINFFYYQGTSHKDRAGAFALDINGDPVSWSPVSGVMTTKDRAWEINLQNRYNIYENLIAVLDFAYLKPNFDDDLGGRDNDYMRKGAFKASLAFQYNF